MSIRLLLNLLSFNHCTIFIINLHQIFLELDLEMGKGESAALCYKEPGDCFFCFVLYFDYKSLNVLRVVDYMYNIVCFRDVFMEKHWRSVINKSICDYFFEAQSKVWKLTETCTHTNTSNSLLYWYIAIGTSLLETLLPRTSSSTEDIVTNPAVCPPLPLPPHPPTFQILHSWDWTLPVYGSYSTHCLVLLIFIVAAVMVPMIVLNTPTSNPWFWFDAVCTSIPSSVPNWFSNIFHAYLLQSIP